MTVPVSDPPGVYYAAFRRRRGFADSAMRGHCTGENTIVVRPSTDYDETRYDAGKFTAGRERPGRALSARPRVEAAAARTMERAVGTAALLNELRHLVEKLRPRIAAEPGAAVRDAMADAENVLRDLDAVAKGEGRADVLRSLVRVLSRHA